MNTTAVLLAQPNDVELAGLHLKPMGDEDAVVDVRWSGISTGTERLLYDGRMPDFPGMGYPLVPGYEAVGEIVEAGPDSGRLVGETVFVPGSQGFEGARGLFGAAASRLMVPGSRAIPSPPSLGEKAVLLALAATAHHALLRPSGVTLGLIVGHGTLGRLLARLALALELPVPTVWESDPTRRIGHFDYPVMDAADDPHRAYDCIIDASGCVGLLDTLIDRLAPRGEVVLAGFYHERLSFDFPTAFMREARIAISAEFLPEDVDAVLLLLEADRLSLDGLISHREPAQHAASAYETAFHDPECLKMVLDWREM